MNCRRADLARVLWVIPLLAALARPGLAASSTAPATRAAPAQTEPAIGPSQNLLAHGTDEYFWVAHVQPAPDQNPPGEMTRISVRSAGAETWQHLADLPVRVIGLASYGSQLAVLREGGEWALLSDNGGSTGLRLPDDAQMLALANDGVTLWAVGMVQPNAVATQSATKPATTGPSTGPVGSASQQLLLYVLESGEWKRVSGPSLPAGLPIDAPLSLVVIDHVPHLAIRREDATIQVLRQTPSGWQPLARLPAPIAPGAFKLLAGMTPPSLWIAGPESDRLELLSAAASTRTIALKEARAPMTERAAVYAIHLVREIAFVDGKLVEQDYDPQTLQPIGSTGTITMPAATMPSIYTGLFRLGLTLALIFAIFSSSRRRGELTENAAKLQNLMLADLGRRLLAGIIDGVPFIAPLVVILQHVRDSSGNMQTISANAPQMQLLTWLSLAAILLYLIHTAATEALAGRTIGKMVMGLRVVRLDGGTPDASALLIRNFLRVLDICLGGVPLVFVIFSPLRQRIGDVAAGTVVIRDRVRPEGNLVEPPKEETAARVEPPEAAGD